MKRIMTLGLALLAVAGLTACGQKGPLIMPEPETQAPAEAAETENNTEGA